MSRYLSVLAMVLLAIRGLAADQPVMTYIHQCPSADAGNCDHYQWRVLRGALEHSRAGYGDYLLVASPVIPESRRIYVLEHGGDGINMAVFPFHPNLEGKLIPVRIPIDRGLLGYRIMLIRASDQVKFDKVRSLADLREIRFGLLASWVDVPILRQSGLQVVAGDSYEGLFRMLAAGRFDAFDRSANQILQEFDDRKAALPGIAVERHLLLRYPMPDYFWFPNTDDGRRRAERVSAGLAAMVADGSLEAMFQEEFAPLIARLDLEHRRVIDLPNPLIGASEPLNDTRLWYSPTTRQ